MSKSPIVRWGCFLYRVYSDMTIKSKTVSCRSSLKFLSCVMTTLLLSSCSDVVESYYATRAEAEQQKMFEKGWLPSCIPTSATQIQTNNDLDLNTSEGSFQFNPKDWKSFKRSCTLENSKGTFKSSLSTDFLAKGYIQVFYYNNDTHWQFFCKPNLGVCYYLLNYKSAKTYS